MNEHLDVDPVGSTRPVVRGREGIVTSGHHLTSMAAMRMLLDGGNAFDAAVAAGFAAAVIEPIAAYSLAGEAVGMVYHAASRKMLALCGQGVAGQAATVQAFRQRGLEKIPTGPDSRAHLSFTVPGAVGAYLLLLADYGTKTVQEVLQPAIDCAEKGFPMYQYMHRVLNGRGMKQAFDRYPPGGTEVFYPGGQTPAVGSLFVQPRLAGTLRLLVEAERGTGESRREGIEAARKVFYEGEVARCITDFSNRVGGFLQAADLREFRARFETPIHTTFAGFKICTQSTWTQGAVLLQVLNMLEHVDLRGLGHNSPAYVSTITECLKLAFADREHYYGDPDLADVPIEALLSKEYAAAKVGLVNPAVPHPGLPAPGDPLNCRAVLEDAPPPPTVGMRADPAAAEEGTTHLSVVDREGNMVCLTPSGGAFGKSAFVPELGFALSTRSEMFFLDENHPNGLQPGKRPRTTLVSYFACSREGGGGSLGSPGDPVMTFGCPGGDDQAQANLQLMLNVMVFAMNPQQAVEAPRFSTQSMSNSFYPRDYFPGRLHVETAMSDEVAAAVAAMGHEVVRVGACGIGAIVTCRDPRSGILSSGADPRRPTYGMAI